MATGKHLTWAGERDRELSLRRPCQCRCDGCPGENGVGYLTGSTSEGRGFTLWIEDEELYQTVEAVFEELSVLA